MRLVGSDAIVDVQWTDTEEGLGILGVEGVIQVDDLIKRVYRLRRVWSTQ